MDWKQFEVEELLHIEKFYSFFESYFDVSYRFNGEAHAFWECIYVKEGEICAVCAKAYILSNGGVFFACGNCRIHALTFGCDIFIIFDS